jgi:hypothetical protein
MIPTPKIVTITLMSLDKYTVTEPNYRALSLTPVRD